MAKTQTSLEGTVKTIDTKFFDETIVSFKNALEQYREARKLIFDSTEKLLFTWEGEGKDSFQKQYDILKTKLTDEEDNLRTIKENLEDTKQTYVEWDDSIAAQFKGN